MPTYEYQCQKCGFEFEREQRITEDPIKTCPKCRSRQAKRLLSAPGFILKGGGWYADGYGSSGAKSAGGGDEGGAATTESTTGKSEGAGGSGSEKSSKSSGDGASGGKDSGGKKSKKSAA